MIRVAAFLEAFPIASFVFAVYAVAGGVSRVLGGLDNGVYVDSLLKVGGATGAIGLARAVAKR